MFNRLEPKTRFIITAVAFTAVILLLSLIVLYYALPVIFEKSGDIKETKIKLATLEEKKNILLAEEEKRKLLSANIDAVEAAIVPQNNPVNFLDFLERLADHEHLTINIKPATGQSGTSPDTITLTASVTGTMQQGINFVKNISMLPFIVTVSDVALSQTITATSAETKSNTKPKIPLPEETTTIMTLLIASRS